MIDRGQTACKNLIIKQIPDFEYLLIFCLFTELVLEVIRGAEIITSYFAAAKDAEEKVTDD